MKLLTVRELNQRTAHVVRAVENGETFEVRRNGKAIGYFTHAAPRSERKPDWPGHFARLLKRKNKGGGFIEELNEERKRLHAREHSLNDLK